MLFFLFFFCHSMILCSIYISKHLGSLNFKCLFEKVIDRFEYEYLALWAIIARIIRFRRNSEVHDDSFSHLEKVIREATISLEEFKTANVGEYDMVQRQQRASSDAWKKSSHGVVKVSWDAAINKIEGYTGCGIVIEARSTTQVSSMDPTMADAWVALHALLFSK
jgi:hypothetical protein